MAKIPYSFDLPPPKYFRDNGWFTNPNMAVFIHWAFSRCSLEKRTVYHIQQAIELEPFEFIFGRRICSEETGLSERQIRTCIEQLSDQQKTPFSISTLQKSTSKSTNKYSVYKWAIELFHKTCDQQDNQQATSRRPADDHNQEDKIDRSKKDHPPNPPSSKSDDDDDFSSKENEKQKEPIEDKVEIIPRVFLSKKQLDLCISIKGDIDSVRYAMTYILESPGRTKEITNWPNALRTWKIPLKVIDIAKENEELSQPLIKDFAQYIKGWRCYIYVDKMKDQRGILFQNQSDYVKTEFFSFSKNDFKSVVYNFLITKNLIKQKVTTHE